MINITEQLIQYECGNLTESETIQLFQHLIDSGLVYMLQGHYGRRAEALIEAGVCQRWQPCPGGACRWVPPKYVPRNPPWAVLC